MSQAGAHHLPVLAVVLPLAGLAAALVLGQRRAQQVVLVLATAGIVVAVALATAVLRAGEPLVLDGQSAPFGIALRADGLSAAMLLVVAGVIGATALFARAEARGSALALVFWMLLPALWAGMNALVLSGDLFALFLAQELILLAAVWLVCLGGGRKALAAALRYLGFALLGSVLYLAGAALLLGNYGTLDIEQLSGRVRADTPTLVAAALMSAGLVARTALFPLHLWLPAAHAAAVPAAAALLAALVVKASFIVLVRLWFGAMPTLLSAPVVQLFGALGAGAVLVGGVMALRQPRLKMLLAYSTVAQLGYLALMIPLLAAGAGDGGAAWLGGVLQAVSHATAKAAMYLAAGCMIGAAGHDRVAALGAAGRVAPMGVLAFGLGGLSLAGIPPSGGFTAKWLLLTGAISAGQWWWAPVIVGGGLLTVVYVQRVLSGATAGLDGTGLDGAGRAEPPAARTPQVVALGLALASVVLGLVPVASFGLLQVGRPGAMAGLP